MLGIGAALLGSSHVIGVDIDSDALETAQANLDSFEDVQVSLPTLHSSIFFIDVE